MDETKVWQEYQEGLAYQQSLGLTNEVPQFERFKQGEQWPPATKRTKNMPRPVFNIVEMFIRSKRASVLNAPLTINFRASEVDEENEDAAEMAVQGAKNYSDYTENLWEAMEQDELNNEMIDDAATSGTGVLHYYWDNDVSGGQNVRYKGDLRGEHIDILDVYFANPLLADEQKQPWIIIRSRERVEAVREYAENSGVKKELLALIQPDDGGNDYESERGEQSGKLVTILTKYYRKNGAVVYDRATQSVMIVNGKSLTPGRGEMPGDAEESDMMRQDDAEEKEADSFEITLYPVIVMRWKKRKKCIYGVGDAKDIITINKAYNFLRAMQLLSVQQAGWPKIITPKGALKQEITNEPGEVIVDYSGDGNAIRYLSPPNRDSGASGIAEEIFTMARTTSGVTDVSTGEVIGKNMAASAIMALQNQARTPIREIQKRFHQAMKRAGRIFEQFYKSYYNLPRLITAKDENGQETTRSFVGTDYADVDFRLLIDVGSGSEFGDELTMATLDKLYEKGDLTVDQYIELAPQSVVPFRERLKKMREEAAVIPPEVTQALENNPQLLEVVMQIVAQATVNGEEVNQNHEMPVMQ